MLGTTVVGGKRVERAVRPENAEAGGDIGSVGEEVGCLARGLIPVGVEDVGELLVADRVARLQAV
jgi:hypothetical protein